MFTLTGSRNGLYIDMFTSRHPRIHQSEAGSKAALGAIFDEKCVSVSSRATFCEFEHLFETSPKTIAYKLAVIILVEGIISYHGNES